MDELFLLCRRKISLELAIGGDLGRAVLHILHHIYLMLLDVLGHDGDNYAQEVGMGRQRTAGLRNGMRCSRMVIYWFKLKWLLLASGMMYNRQVV